MAPSSRADCVIGHIIGFLRERQRPDARQHVRFNCRALEDYALARTHIGSVQGEPAFHPGMTLDERVDLVFVPTLPLSEFY